MLATSPLNWGFAPFNGCLCDCRAVLGLLPALFPAFCHTVDVISFCSACQFVSWWLSLHRLILQRDASRCKPNGCEGGAFCLAKRALQRCHTVRLAFRFGAFCAAFLPLLRSALSRCKIKMQVLCGQEVGVGASRLAADVCPCAWAMMRLGVSCQNRGSEEQAFGARIRMALAIVGAMRSMVTCSVRRSAFVPAP